MNRLAKVLSVVISATLALSIAVVMLVSAFAVSGPTFSINAVNETDEEVTIAIKLDSGKFSAVDLQLTVAKDSKVLGACKSAKMSNEFKLTDGAMGQVNAANGKLSAAATPDYEQVGDVAFFTFAKKAIDKVTENDVVLTFSTLVIGENQVKATIVNNLPKSEVVTTTAPETTAPETTAPETTAPETTAPETTAPETTAPETTAPETTAPETTAPETTAPETTAPETTAPETTAPETTAPETTAPETTAPETTAPETTAPETTAPETTAPETTVPAVDGDVVNPDTGDSVTATAAIVSLLAVSGASIVALRKKED